MMRGFPIEVTTWGDLLMTAAQRSPEHVSLAFPAVASAKLNCSQGQSGGPGHSVRSGSGPGITSEYSCRI